MGLSIVDKDSDSYGHFKMPINLPVPQDVQPQSLYQLLADILRRATDGTVVLPVGGEPTYAPINASTSGRRYRIQVVEVTDPDTQQITGVLSVDLVV